MIVRSNPDAFAVIYYLDARYHRAAYARCLAAGSCLNNRSHHILSPREFDVFCYSCWRAVASILVFSLMVKGSIGFTRSFDQAESGLTCLVPKLQCFADGGLGDVAHLKDSD